MTLVVNYLKNILINKSAKLLNETKLWRHHKEMKELEDKTGQEVQQNV